ncbi:MAG: TonB-dependent receptor [Sphingomonadales bacterium]|nr:TonB-dependent receptor [Sphingomonadales bacterium]
MFAKPVLLAALAVSTPAIAAESDGPTIVVTATVPADPIAPPPATRATTDAAKIATTVNAVSVEDTLKYFPSLVVRKRHIGDNFAPVATRTSGLGASARSLIYADGALLSALIGNNNGNGSPRWTLVTPEEIQSIDVLYGPFSAAYSGNSIGTVIAITTRMPDRLEARATALVNVQQFDLYDTHQTLPTWQVSGSVGDRFGNLAVLLSATRTEARSQPISFVTTTTQPTGTTGGHADVNKLNQPIRVLGAGGIEHHVQATYKAKLAYDLTPSIRLAYTLGVWTDDTSGDVQSYEQSPSGGVAYATLNSGATPGFNAAVYARDALHVSHALGLTGKSPTLDWQVIGTLYRYAHDWQDNPSPDTASANAANGFLATRNDLPAAFAGGFGTIQKQDGTGWGTLDAKAALHRPGNDLSFGAHADRETLDAATYGIANWLDPHSALGQLRSRSYGRTRTLALWAQDVVKLAPGLALTLGGRQEWWRAWGGLNTAYTASVNTTLAQPERSFSGFSPKASLEWRLGNGLTARLSAGQAWRMPTVGELYQTVTVGTLLSNPNPGLAPERARSLELALERRDSHGSIRVSLFNEVITGALISQLNATTSTTFVQNVDQTRARGLELAIDRRNLLPHVDLSASLTYADAITSRDAGFPAAVGKLLPSVPHWKGNAVLTWRPTQRISLTSAVRFTSRNYANLANDDTVGNTYQGFYKYTVVDLRARFTPTDRFAFSVGVDNLNNNKYFLFHPFPQRSFTAQIDWKL